MVNQAYINLAIIMAPVIVMAIALFVEEGIVAYNKKKLVDNPALW
jgi:hypothetical protein